MTFLEKIKCIERVDQLIRLKATGQPRALARRLGISENSVYDLINKMKEMGAEIYYCSHKKSYCYHRQMYFFWGFKLENGERIYGGENISSRLNSIFLKEINKNLFNQSNVYPR